MYSIHWVRTKFLKFNTIQVQVTLIDEQGSTHKVDRYYQNWIGVCTNKIESLIASIQENFPGEAVSYTHIGEAKKILPYFEDRLITGKLKYSEKPFYKIYTTVYHEDVGKFFQRYKIAYFGKEDWLVRIYIDLCIRYNSFGFYYKWYNVNPNSSNLLDSFEMLPDRTDIPNWVVAAFDLETVPLVGNHIPMGFLETDIIVMISVFKWSSKKGIEQFLLYLLPEEMDPVPGYPKAYKTESNMLYEFHLLIQDAHILTGYNINAYDFVVLFARLIHLQKDNLLIHYSSQNIGQRLVTTIKNKLVLDLYQYIDTFSGYNLPSYKLDDVARIKLGNDCKVPIKSIGIWSWYRNKLTPEIYQSNDIVTCYNYLKPLCKTSEFGTYKMYLEYCLKDSELVYKLFEKEHILSFLVERANFTSLNAAEALYFGNSRYLLELFKTYGTRLGFFFNERHYKSNFSNYKFILGNKNTYQGGLNYCISKTFYKDVVVMDFSSMYPSALLSNNLCYGTCTIMTREKWLNTRFIDQMISIPYREHSLADFQLNISQTSFSYPTLVDENHIIVINPHTEAFLPTIVNHFLKLRQYHQKMWKDTKNIYHYNVQLGIKILVNSLYGIMATKESHLAYVPIGIIIATMSRYQLLGSYHYLKQQGYTICYADTDSLMVHKWPYDNCHAVNAFINIPNVELKYEQRMKWFLVLSKKKYVYQTEKNKLVTKGFQKKTNKIVEFMTDYILKHVWKALFKNSSSSQGWIIWMSALLEAHYMCRDAQKYSIYRKIKPLNEYKSKNCPSVRYLEKYPNRINEHVEFTYSRADVVNHSKFIMDASECLYVNVEKLFMNQKANFCNLLNMAYWKLPNPRKRCDMVLNTIRWGIFNRIELLHYFKTNRKLKLLVLPKQKYPFFINNHINICKRRFKRLKI